MAFLIPFPEFKDYAMQEVSFLQLKYDGHLGKIYRGQGDVQIFSKNDIDITDKAMSCEQVAKVLSNVPKHSILFGELFSEGAAATVPTLLKQGSQELQFRAFAAPVFATNNWFNRDLIDTVEELETKGITCAYTARLQNGQVDREGLLARAVQKGIEGWVLKLSHMKGWYKLKPVKTADVVVTATKQSWTANHFGDLQCVVVSVYNDKGQLVTVGNVGTGFTEEFRKTVDRHTLLGKVCEVSFDSFMVNAMRFPRFVRWREDKNPQDCKWTQFE